MNISPDGVSVRFKTEPEERFLAEKSGAKPNTVRIMDISEADQIQQAPPTKIFIHYEQEIFLRTLTNICIAGEVLGQAIVIFSGSNEIVRDPHAHTLSLDKSEPPLYVQAINISLPLREKLDLARGDKTYDELIFKLLNDFIQKHAEEVGSLHD